MRRYIVHKTPFMEVPHHPLHTHELARTHAHTHTPLLHPLRHALISVKTCWVKAGDQVLRPVIKPDSGLLGVLLE